MPNKYRTRQSVRAQNCGFVSVVGMVRTGVESFGPLCGRRFFEPSLLLRNWSSPPLGGSAGCPRNWIGRAGFMLPWRHSNGTWRHSNGTWRHSKEYLATFQRVTGSCWDVCCDILLEWPLSIQMMITSPARIAGPNSVLPRRSVPNAVAATRMVGARKQMSAVMILIMKITSRPIFRNRA